MSPRRRKIKWERWCRKNPDKLRRKMVHIWDTALAREIHAPSYFDMLVGAGIFIRRSDP